MKLISANFNPGTGESIVKIGNKYGTFTGKARLHPDDKNHSSNYAGCRLAEYRAQIKFLQTLLPRKKAMLKAVENLKKDIEINCYLYRDIEKRINLAIRDYSNDIAAITDEIHEIKELINKDIKTRDTIKATKVKTE